MEASLQITRLPLSFFQVSSFIITLHNCNVEQKIPDTRMHIRSNRARRYRSRASWRR